LHSLIDRRPRRPECKEKLLRMPSRGEIAGLPAGAEKNNIIRGESSNRERGGEDRPSSKLGSISRKEKAITRRERGGPPDPRI